MYVLAMILISAFSGGSAPIFGKILLNVFEPFTLLTFRFYFASLALLPFIEWKDLNPKVFTKYLWIGLIGALNPILLFLALPDLSASIVPLLYAGTPVLTVIYSRYLKNMRYTKNQIIGIILGLLGILIVVESSLFTRVNDTNIKGLLIGLLAVCTFALFSVLSCDLQKKHQISSRALTFYLCCTALIISLPFSLWEISITPIEIVSLTPYHLISLVSVGALSTSIAFLSYQHILKTNSAHMASIVTYFQPFATITLGVMLLDEKITIALIIGGAFALIGGKLVSASKETIPKFQNLNIFIPKFIHSIRNILS